MDTGDGDKVDGKRKGLRTVPPGFARGLRLPGDESQDDETLATLDEIPVTGGRYDAEQV